MKNCTTGAASVSKMALEGSFSCWNGTSIRLGQACDFIRDCTEGEDEGAMCRKLPPGFYCSFEEGDCGWMEGSSASHASPWRIGSLEYNHFPSVEDYALILDTSKAPAGASTVMTSATFPTPLRNSPCELRMSWLIRGVLLGNISLVLVENKTGKELSRTFWHSANSEGLGIWQWLILPLPDILDRFWFQIIASWERGSNAVIAFDNVSLSLDCFLTINGEKIPRSTTPDSSNLLTSRRGPNNFGWEQKLLGNLQLGTAPISGPAGGHNQPGGVPQTYLENGGLTMEIQDNYRKEALARSATFCTVCSCSSSHEAKVDNSPTI